MATTIPNRQISPEKLVKISEIFSGLAYPVRIQILELLEDGKDYPVNEILAKVQIEASLLSHHLSKMKNIGIIDSYREGRFIYYRLALKEITKVFDCIYSCELKL
ncbi:MAG: metalloregulator ArsR/SmtB family transcription factor [Cyclobacteriaceae bacterium]|nr:metalloregulator ArsR/SmtB family transcription factor [Cyclobacteriaceae bacterium]